METTQYKLTKASGEAGIRQYFEAIVRLERDNKQEFPIDLDAVWELAYERKDYAVKALESVFIKGSDYQTFRQKAEAGSHNKTVVNKYFLTVPAMEWFVARRVPAVFAVYREVFHQSVKNQAPKIDSKRVYLCGMIGAPLEINGIGYWPYAQVMTAAGYRNRPSRLYKLANANIDRNQLFPCEDGMFVEEYGRIWAREEVFTALEKRKQAWLALDAAQREVNAMLCPAFEGEKIGFKRG